MGVQGRAGDCSMLNATSATASVEAASLAASFAQGIGAYSVEGGGRGGGGEGNDDDDDDDDDDEDDDDGDSADCGGGASTAQDWTAACIRRSRRKPSRSWFEARNSAVAASPMAAGPMDAYTKTTMKARETVDVGTMSPSGLYTMMMMMDDGLMEQI
jgi:hypothetical protein